MDISVSCKHCGKSLSVRERYRGSSLPCPGCGQAMLIGEETPTPVPTQAQTPASFSDSQSDQPGFATESIVEPDDMGTSQSVQEDPEMDEFLDPATPAVEKGSRTVAGKKIAIRKESKAVDMEAKRHVRNPIKTRRNEADVDNSLAQRLGRLQEKQSTRRKNFYVGGTIVIILCIALNIFFTFPIIFGNPQRLTQEGDKLIEIGQVPDAIKKYKSAIRIAGTYYPAYLRLGMAYMTQKEYDLAEKTLTDMLSSQDHDLLAKGYVLLAKISHSRYLQDGDKNHLKTGLNYVVNAQENDPSNQDARQLFSTLRYTMLVPAAAEDAFRNIFVTRKNQLEAHNNRAFIQENISIIETSMEDLNGETVLSYYLKAVSFESPEKTIHPPRMDNSIRGTIDLEVYTWKTRPQKDQMMAQKDFGKENFTKILPGEIQSIEFLWTGDTWAIRHDPIAEYMKNIPPPSDEDDFDNDDFDDDEGDEE